MGVLDDFLYTPRANNAKSSNALEFSIENLSSLQEEEYNNFLKDIYPERRYFSTPRTNRTPLTKVQLLQNFVDFYSEDYSSEEILAQVEKRWARADVVPTNIGDFSFNLSNYMNLLEYCSIARGTKTSAFRKEWERYIDEMRRKINEARPSKKR